MLGCLRALEQKDAPGLHDLWSWNAYMILKSCHDIIDH